MKQRKRCEFTKVILAAVMGLYFITTIFDVVVTAFNPELIGELYAFVGAPTAVVRGN